MRFSSLNILWKIAPGLALLLLFFFFPAVQAFAQGRAASTLGLVDNVGNQAGNIPRAVAIACYVIGCVFAFKGLMLMRGLGDQKGGEALMPMIGFLSVGTLLILLPYSIETTVNSLGIAEINNNGAESASDTYAIGNNSDNPTGGMQKIFFNLVQNTQGFPAAMMIFSYVMAVIMTLGGLYDLKTYGDDPSRASVKAVVSKFALAASLLSIPFAMQIIITTVTGANGIEDREVLDNRPCIMKGSGLMGLRGGTATGSGC